MTHNINPQTDILVECFFSFGLERRLRRYERIREVLNSWDRDSQYVLLIVQDETVERSRDLSIEYVSRSPEAPQGFINFPLQHSQKPGRWNKRLLLTLLETGQLYSHKKKGAKLSDKDSTILCNLSDFDLYNITDEDMLRGIKPPKKHTFAIKSQQKQNVFLNTENYIHFFSTDEADVARNFQLCVHRWRSWYLVNKKVDLQDKEKALHKNGGEVQSSADIVRSGGHRLKVSVDETPYTIGTFQPLMDMDRFDKPLEDFGKDFLPAKTGETPVVKQNIKDAPLHIQKPQIQKPSQSETRGRSTTNPIQSPDSPLSPISPPQRIDVFAKDDKFKTSGLLGKIYDGRKHQLEAARSSDDEPTEGPFTGGLLEEHDQEVALKQLQHHQHKLQLQQQQVEQLNRSNTTVGRSNTTAARSKTTVGREGTRIARSNTFATTDSPPISSDTQSSPRYNNLVTRSNTLLGRDDATRSGDSTPLSRSNTTRRSPPSKPEGSDSRQRSRSRSRSRAGTATSTSGGRPTTSDGASYGRMKDKPAPLLDIAPAIPEIPSAWRDRLKHGAVKAPSGAPLVSMATDSHPRYMPPGMVMSPPTSPPGVARRATTKSSPGMNGQRGASSSAPGSTAGAAAVQQRSHSTAPTSSGRRYASHEARPPVPLIASVGGGHRHTSARRPKDDEDVPLINFVDRTRGREMGARGLESRSRSGTLRQA